LEGERLGLRADLSAVDAVVDTGDVAEQAHAVRALALRTPKVNDAWTHRFGSAQHQIDQPALGLDLSLVWSANIGQGDTRKQRITADPVVAGGVVFTLDSAATVTATSTNGIIIWQRDLTPASDRSSDASGGGLAVAGDTLFVTTGFGALTAINVGTGESRWSQDLEAPTSGAPTVADGIVYAVAGNAVAWAIDSQNGRVKWTQSGLPSGSDVVGGAAPVVVGDLAVFAFPNGDVRATFKRGGIRRWETSLYGERKGRSYATVKDVTSDPVVHDGRIYLATQSGRMAALDVQNGERLWTAMEGALSPVWPADDSIFFVSDQAELLRVDARTGERIWGVDLPYFENERDRGKKAVFSHYGPIIAGGRLIVASNDGTMRSFDPSTGQALGATSIPGGASTNPVVVDESLYVVSASGKLHAFR
jgi:outer membrane protein assembly factor BamB